jgi:hypothetical protein
MSFYLREQQHRSRALLFATSWLRNDWLFQGTRAMCVATARAITPALLKDPTMIRYMMLTPRKGAPEIHRYLQTELLEVFGKAGVEQIETNGYFIQPLTGIWVDMERAARERAEQILHA